ncbi:MscS Mechanosensitive ion channel [Melioribacter roseus P3M-2]|uniref:Mechanosensing system component YbdG n=1 Tax=Melioribacter roseus (strain DSM 23840 / JCM 17771 / VKM B-2668 / P3M-2) TaxID=1191523 RepID=I6Z6P5_MELRP|nr:mechanosensitive ion channel family protein [Melioribacter roseus]AFN74835.1 MscS Mechanosensitive ion channel [Melioribacter roseus P3M-2]
MKDSIEKLMEEYPIVAENIKFLGILLLAVIAYFLTKNILLRLIKKFVRHTKTELDDILLHDRVLKNVSYIAPLIIIKLFAYTIPSIENFIHVVINALIVLLIIFTISGFLTGFTEVLSRMEKFKEKPVKGYIQVVKIIVYIFGGVIFISTLLGESPWALLGGLSALTAVLVLVFRDTILSFVASVQISSYDLVKVGDWIEVPKYGADGDVIDISLNVIKIQNWDKTITVIPTYKLIEDSFKNWRGMTLSGGRRIKRSVYIDQSSIKFCTEEMIAKFERIQLLKDYIKNKREEIKKYNEERNIDDSVLVNGRRMTNVGTFRAYLKEYLLQREDINKDMTFLVRHLPPGPQGLPIEIYVFTKTTNWNEYEEIQSNIFDHILAVIPQFELRVFQNPTGHDIKEAVNSLKELK